jgi:hypothetical protein
MNKMFCKAKFSFLSLISAACYQMTLLVGLPESYGRRIRSPPLSTSSFHRGPAHSHITRGMNYWPVGGRSSETYYHPIDMIIIIIINTVQNS